MGRHRGIVEKYERLCTYIWDYVQSRGDYVETRGDSGETGKTTERGEMFGNEGQGKKTEWHRKYMEKTRTAEGDKRRRRRRSRERKDPKKRGKMKTRAGDDT